MNQFAQVARVASWMVALAAIGGGAAPAARMHDIHSTLTVVRVSRDGVELRLRAFADDLSAAVAIDHGRAAPADSAVSPQELERYVGTRVALHGGDGVAWRLEPCGLERQGEVYLACFRAPANPRTRLARVKNTVLFDRHADQVNVVQLELEGRRTLLLTRARPEATLGR